MMRGWAESPSSPSAIRRRRARGVQVAARVAAERRRNIESQYAYWLTQKHEDWKVLNRGVNGERSDQIRARFDRDVSARNRQPS
jgi:hypothetical protein